MNYNFISQLLDNGISEEELIASLSKSIPRLAKKAKQMYFGGWSPKDVLGLFSKDKEVQKVAKKGLKPVTSSEMASMHLRNSYNDIPQSAGQESKEKLTEFTKQAAPYALGYAGSKIAGPIVGSVVQNALERALPQQPLIKDALSHQNNDKIQSQEPLTQLNQLKDLNALQPPSMLGNANITQPVESVQPEEKSNIVNKLWSNFEKGKDKGFDFESDAFLKIAKRMKSTGEIKSKEDFERFFQIYDQKKSQGKDLIGALREASSEYDNEKLSPKSKEESQPIKIEKKSLVSSPNGIGEVKEIRNGKALIDVDGKIHKVKEEDLEASPLPEKDLADLYDDLISGIEGETGEDVSRMVQWAGYNPDTNQLQFLPHTGKLYTYGDISEEDAELLRNILSVRKTTGSNFIGAWKASSKSPIGAALSKLIRKLQSERGGKGQEYEASYEPIYSAYEPAIEAKKRKKKK